MEKLHSIEIDGTEYNIEPDVIEAPIDNKSYLRRNGNWVNAPELDGQVINITDGEDITSKMQAFLDNGGVIYVNGIGTALISQDLKFKKDNTHVVIEDSVTLKIADGTFCRMFTTPGAYYYYNDSRVGTETLNNISIYGGTLDFNRAGNEWDNAPRPRSVVYHSGIVIVDVNGFSIEHVRMLTATKFTSTYAGLKNFLIRDIHLECEGGNCDGLHFHGDCNNGVIEHITGYTIGDDFIGLNCGGDYIGDTPVGTESWMPHREMLREGDSRYITIRDIQYDKSKGDGGIRLLNGDTHIYDFIDIENINVYVQISAYGCNANYGNIRIKNSFYKRDKYINVGHAVYINTNDDVSQEQHVHVDNLVLDNIISENKYILGLKNCDVDNLTLTNSRMIFKPDVSQNVDNTPVGTYVLPPIFILPKNHTECTFKNIVVSNFISNGDRRGWKIPYFVQAHKVDNLLVSNSILYYSDICSDSSANILQNNIILKETDNVN